MIPTIGVTAPMKGGLTQNLAIRLALYLSGANSINLTPEKPRYNAPIDGLVLSGGTHLHPSLFLSKEIQKDYQYDKQRDELELSWLKKAKENNIPIFSICRGAQLLNIFHGGTLHTDITKVYENANYPNSLIAKIFFRKKILIKENSCLNEIFNEKETKVNSMHSQAIGEVGKNLNVTAVETNGVVQAIEHQGKNFIMGFQFHPEFLIYRNDIQKIFKKFIKSTEK